MIIMIIKLRFDFETFLLLRKYITNDKQQLEKAQR